MYGTIVEIGIMSFMNVSPTRPSSSLRLYAISTWKCHVNEKVPHVAKRYKLTKVSHMEYCIDLETILDVLLDRGQRHRVCITKISISYAGGTNESTEIITDENSTSKEPTCESEWLLPLCCILFRFEGKSLTPPTHGITNKVFILWSWFEATHCHSVDVLYSSSMALVRKYFWAAFGVLNRRRFWGGKLECGSRGWCFLLSIPSHNCRRFTRIGFWCAWSDQMNLLMQLSCSIS